MAVIDCVMLPMGVLGKFQAEVIDYYSGKKILCLCESVEAAMQGGGGYQYTELLAIYNEQTKAFVYYPNNIVAFDNSPAAKDSVGLKNYNIYWPPQGGTAPHWSFNWTIVRNDYAKILSVDAESLTGDPRRIEAVKEVNTKNAETIVNTLLEDKVFTKPMQSYIEIGDEPNVFSLNIKAQMTEAEVLNLKSVLSLIPRQYLRGWFDVEIVPKIPGSVSISGYAVKDGPAKKPFEDNMWQSFIELFNEANIDYCLKNSLDAWEWERQKMEAYLLSQNADGLKEINAYMDSNKNYDPQARELAVEYAKLPRLGDPGLETRRQFSIKTLLEMKEYDDVRAIIDAYKFANNSILSNPLKEPIPYNIIGPGGDLVRKTEEDIPVNNTFNVT